MRRGQGHHLSDDDRERLHVAICKGEVSLKDLAVRSNLSPRTVYMHRSIILGTKGAGRGRAYRGFA